MSRVLLVLVLGLLFSRPAAAAEPMTLRDYMALGGPAPTERIAYGSGPLQYVELFRPAGRGPFPVAVLIHGGCFLNAYGGVPQMRGIAGALAARGVAVWNVEYRGLDAAGGGYPGTFLDIRAAFDLLRARAARLDLDPRRLVAVGHSAGAALALWAAGRNRLPEQSPLHEADPLAVPEVVSLGGYAHLRAIVGLAKAGCDLDMSRLVGPPSAVRPDPFADTDPFDLRPDNSATVFINGDQDRIVPPEQSSEDAALLRADGDAAETVVLPRASHYDEVATTSPAWAVVEPVILRALGMP